MTNTSSGDGTPGRFNRLFPQNNLSISTSNWSRLRDRLALVCLLALAINSTGCKDPDELGLEVLPASDALGMTYSDTMTITTRTVREDSLRSDELSAQLIGSYIDPYFGKSNAECYSEVLLQGTPNFSTHQVTDSLVLKLFYKGFYGDTNTQQVIRVFRLTESMSADSNYFSNRTFTTESTPLGTLSFMPMPNTTVVIDSDTVAPQIRIPLDLVLADSLIALNGSTTFQSNEAWRQYFKGIKLSIDEATATGQGCISYFDLFNARMTLYYHDTANAAKNYSWVLTGAKSNFFTHDYTGFPAGNHLQDSTYADTVTCLQGMAGLKTRFELPYFEHLKDSGNIILNRAELKVTLTDGTTSPYPAPSSLLIVAINEDGVTTSFPADYFEAGSFFGGSLDSRTYTFNLTRHLNQVLSGVRGNYGYYLVVSGSSIQASRAIISSGKSQANPMKLNLYYTRLY